MANTAGYTPGVCNIGRAEIRLRRSMGLLTAAITLAMLLWIALAGGPAWLRWLTFVPATAAAQGLLQAYLGFCTGYGLRGVFNMGDRAGQAKPVVDPRALAADRRKALLIIVASAAIGGVVTALAWLL